jgi:hypothetical protein
LIKKIGLDDTTQRYIFEGFCKLKKRNRIGFLKKEFSYDGIYTAIKNVNAEVALLDQVEGPMVTVLNVPNELILEDAVISKDEIKPEKTFDQMKKAVKMLQDRKNLLDVINECPKIALKYFDALINYDHSLAIREQNSKVEKVKNSKKSSSVKSRVVEYIKEDKKEIEDVLNK